MVVAARVRHPKRVVAQSRHPGGAGYAATSSREATRRPRLKGKNKLSNKKDRPGEILLLLPHLTGPGQTNKIRPDQGRPEFFDLRGPDRPRAAAAPPPYDRRRSTSTTIRDAGATRAGWRGLSRSTANGNRRRYVHPQAGTWCVDASSRLARKRVASGGCTILVQKEAKIETIAGPRSSGDRSDRRFGGWSGSTAPLGLS